MKGFSLDAAKKNVANISGKELENMNHQEEYDFQFIKIEKIKPSSKNDYPMEIIDKLKESIKEHGISHNLQVARIEKDEDGKEYEILSGEQRYRAIKSLIEEGYPIYTNGIPCKVESQATNEIDREIMLIEANEINRADDPVRTRKMTKRLEELYKEKNMKKGEITQKISDVLNIGERQVQRYRTANNNLIQELLDALDESKISLEMATSLASLDEESQKCIASMLSKVSKISKDELAAMQENMKVTEDVAKKQIKELEEQARNQELRYKQLEETLEEKNQSLMKKSKELESLQKEDNSAHINSEESETLKKEVQALNEEIKYLKEEKEKSDHENKSLEKKIQEISKNKSSKEIDIQEVKRIQKEKELELISNNLELQIRKLQEELQDYENTYGSSDISNEIKEKFENII